MRSKRGMRTVWLTHFSCTGDQLLKILAVFVFFGSHVLEIVRFVAVPVIQGHIQYRHVLHRSVQVYVMTHHKVGSDVLLFFLRLTSRTGIGHFSLSPDIQVEHFLRHFLRVKHLDPDTQLLRFPLPLDDFSVDRTRRRDRLVGLHPPVIATDV
jgi:hypothetical protein